MLDENTKTGENSKQGFVNIIQKYKFANYISMFILSRYKQCFFYELSNLIQMY